MKLPRRTLRAAVTVVIATVAAACDAASATDPLNPDTQASIAGNYQLASINQQALPYGTTGSGGTGVLITSGQLVLQQQGSVFTQVLGFSGPAGQWLSPTTGTYTVSGSRVVFRVSTGAEFEGTRLAGDRIEYTVQGNYGPIVFLFRKS